MGALPPTVIPTEDSYTKQLESIRAKIQENKLAESDIKDAQRYKLTKSGREEMNKHGNKIHGQVLCVINGSKPSCSVTLIKQEFENSASERDNESADDHRLIVNNLYCLVLYCRAQKWIVLV